MALGCSFIATASALSIVGSDSIPVLKSEVWGAAAQGPTANRETKTDKLPVVMASLPSAPDSLAQDTSALESGTSESVASEATPDPATTATVDPSFASPLRQAFAADAPLAMPEPTAHAPVVIAPVPAKPKVASKPQAQKTYALLSDAQIAAIKTRLNLSSSQAYYWPSVEDALRAVARKLNATKQANPNGGTPAIDPDSAEVQQLKSAAMPLLFQLRDDQKQEVRSLARIIGLHQVAAAI